MVFESTPDNLSISLGRLDLELRARPVTDKHFQNRLDLLVRLDFNLKVGRAEDIHLCNDTHGRLPRHAC